MTKQERKIIKDIRKEVNALQFGQACLIVQKKRLLPVPVRQIINKIEGLLNKLPE